MKKIIIIGAGVSGLTAGIYALQSGFDVEIYEKHFMTGGVCTSWSRKGYTFEGAVHWLTGSSPKYAFYKLWTDTGVLSRDVKTFRHDPYCVYDTGDQKICLYRDLEKLKAHFLEIAPEDAKAINVLYKDIKSMSGMQMPITDEKGVKVREKATFTLKQMMSMLPAISKMKRLYSVTTTEYLASFHNKELRTLLESLIPKGFSAMGLITTMSTFCADGHFPQGGALALAKRMTDKFTSLGGKVFLSTPVDKVVVENGTATGILVKGEQILGDAVVVTRDVMTADALFNEPLMDDWIVETKANTKPQLCTLVGIGIQGDMSEFPHQLYFNLKEPIEYAGTKSNYFGIINYAAHPEYAPKGCTAATACFVENTYDWWNKAKEEGRYDEEKVKLGKQVVRAIEEKFPHIEGKVEVLDIATPLTYERYTGSYKGSWMSIMEKGTKMANHPVTCKDISGVYFAGFRTQSPGGLPVALSSGRRAAQLVCKQFDMVFEGTKK